jgi:prephenate dehydrogenase
MAKSKFMPPTTVSVIGFGRFGTLLAAMLEPDFAVSVHDRRDIGSEIEKQGYRAVSMADAMNSDVVFFAPPISRFEETIRDAQDHIRRNAPKLLIDVLSVKTYPRDIFKKYLDPGQEALLVHPMFGPDSVLSNGGLAGLPIMVDGFTASPEACLFWKEYFSSKGLRVVPMDADEHDRLAANSQGMAHFIGRVLEDFGFAPTKIDTLGAKKLHEVEVLAANDTPELFHDLQTKNPYTKAMRIKLGESVERVYNQLIPNRINPDKLIVGIQGGKGSFNEQAALYYLERNGVRDFEIKYLYTTENVLKQLHEGDVDRGQFAIHNSLGGIVAESIEAISRRKFHIVEEFAIKISHALMIRPDADPEKIDTIMTHPQVIAQCSKNLAKRYPRYRLTSGEGELIDSALVAKYLSEGKLPSTTAVMGSSVLSQIYGLRIIENNLEDQKENYTSFLWVERPE